MRAVRRPLAATLVSLATAALGSCSHDVLFSRAGGEAGAAGRADPGVPGGGGGGGAAGSGGADPVTGGAASAGAPPVPPLAPGLTWQIQLTGAIDVDVDADLFVTDLFDAPAADRAALIARGRLVVCEFSAGTSESWRADAASLPSTVLGNAVQNAPRETWLDVRADAVRALMVARLDAARARGCHGVLPDAVDGYGADTGFPIGTEEAIDYLAYLAGEAHARDLFLGLANAVELVPEAVSLVDLVVEDRCLEFDECAQYRPFLTAGKPVLHVEFVHDTTEGTDLLGAICGDPSRSGYSTILKLTALDAWRLACD